MLLQNVNNVAFCLTLVLLKFKKLFLHLVYKHYLDVQNSGVDCFTFYIASDICVTIQAATSPDIFISYQWGKQPQVLQLYRALTSLGYSCWLDIMQMGGELGGVYC